MGRVVLITGGMSGIGLATATRFAQAGDKVCIVDRQESSAGKRLVEARGGQFFVADVCDFARAQAVIGEIAAAAGHLDVLINNAGISRDHVIWKMSEADWDEVLAINLKGAFNYLRAAAPQFRQQKSGKVDRKSTRLNSSHIQKSRMPSSA